MQAQTTTGTTANAGTRRGYVLELSETVVEASRLIQALLGAPPPRVWRKFPNVYRRSVDFLHRNPQQTAEDAAIAVRAARRVFATWLRFYRYAVKWRNTRDRDRWAHVLNGAKEIALTLGVITPAEWRRFERWKSWTLGQKVEAGTGKGRAVYRIVHRREPDAAWRYVWALPHGEPFPFDRERRLTFRNWADAEKLANALAAANAGQYEVVEEPE